MTLTGFYAAGGRGDKKLVYRTALMKRLPPYPVFPGEKYVGLGYKYMLADEEAPLLAINRVLCLVEYREDGSIEKHVQAVRPGIPGDLPF